MDLQPVPSEPSAPPLPEQAAAAPAAAAAPRFRIPWRALTMVGALLVIWIVFSWMLPREPRLLTPSERRARIDAIRRRLAP